MYHLKCYFFYVNHAIDVIIDNIFLKRIINYLSFYVILTIKDLHKLREKTAVTIDNCLVKENELLGGSIDTLL